MHNVPETSRPKLPKRAWCIAIFFPTAVLAATFSRSLAAVFASFVTDGIGLGQFVGTLGKTRVDT